MTVGDAPVAAPSEARASRGAYDLAAAVLAPALAAVALGRYGIGGEGLLAAGFAVVLVVLSAIDLRERRLPNRIVLPSIALALVAQAVLHPDRLVEWLAAGAGAAAFFLVPQLVYRGGVGMGDVKLAFLLGVVLGTSVIAALFLATVAASLVALGLLLFRGTAARKTGIPYGPFLAGGALVALLTDVGSPF